MPDLTSVTVERSSAVDSLRSFCQLWGFSGHATDVAVGLLVAGDRVAALRFLALEAEKA